ncbi:hypothetical protein BcFMB_04715 [Bifidobacterium choerinum]|uniref:Uncharacterized protein n=2 Tax=Bifidobacterium choerinum TaxID=35760 RepID=A0A2D3D643_9BIFI|nr:hypothetical protein BcFMB_04715 [Bifidobacterium choerinum]
MTKLPPIEKIPEVWTAIADGHVLLDPAEGRALVTSSDSAKTYTVTFDDDTYTSNDNATYWQGYAGYPIIAVLMLQGRLPLDGSLSEQFKDVDWKLINDRFKRNYAGALDEVISERGLDKERVTAAMELAYDDLKELPLTIRRGSVKPPKSAR